MRFRMSLLLFRFLDKYYAKDCLRILILEQSRATMFLLECTTLNFWRFTMRHPPVVLFFVLVLCSQGTEEICQPRDGSHAAVKQLWGSTFLKRLPQLPFGHHYFQLNWSPCRARIYCDLFIQPFFRNSMSEKDWRQFEEKIFFQFKKW